MKKYLILFLVIITLGCSVQKNDTRATSKAITQKEFLVSPFGFAETIESFTNRSSAKFKTQKLLRKNKHYPEKTDTIFQLRYKKSEILFYKTHQGKEFLLAGKILNKQIKLKNDIQIGISKDQFINKFSNELSFNADSLQMIGEGTKYTFIFQKGKLHRINIDNYFD